MLFEEGGDKPASSETRDLEARGRITEASPPSKAEQALSRVHSPRKSKRFISSNRSKQTLESPPST